MTDEEIIEGNIIIANFMGANIKKGDNFIKWADPGGKDYMDTIPFYDNDIVWKGQDSYMAIDKLKYHSDADWLVPVLHKTKTFGVKYQRLIDAWKTTLEIIKKSSGK